MNTIRLYDFHAVLLLIVAIPRFQVAYAIEIITRLLKVLGSQNLVHLLLVDFGQSSEVSIGTKPKSV